MSRPYSLPNDYGLLKGKVCEQYIRCNKPGCRCRDGEPHGPYYYRVWREGGRVRKVYVHHKDLARVKEACEAYQSVADTLQALRRRREQIMQQIRGQWRRAASLAAQLPSGTRHVGGSKPLRQ